MKGTNFVNLRDAGDPVEVASRYEAEGADELVFLDITASHEGRDDHARRGPPHGRGGLHAADASAAASARSTTSATCCKAGCDKVSINSAAAARSRVRPPGRPAVRQPVHRGQHRPQAGPARTAARSGRCTSTAAGSATGLEAVAWAREVERLGAGEIVLTSMDADGTKNGYDLEITARGERRGGDPGGGQRRGRQARAPGRRDPARARPTRRWRPAFSTTASTRSSETKRVMAERGIPVREADSGALATESSQPNDRRARDALWHTDRPTRMQPTPVRVAERNELEIDKLFRALVKLEGQRPAPEGRHALRTSASTARLRPHEPRADRRRGDGAAAAFRCWTSATARSSTRRRGRLRPRRRRRRRAAGGSASTCCSRWGTWAWSPAA